MEKVTIYTDGACSGNPGPGGWGAVLFYKDNKKLTELEVANILDISQQAVSKRLIKIKNKLKKF